MKTLIRFLRRPRWFTDDESIARNSIFQWGPANEGYYLSILGAINGILPCFGICLVVVDDMRLEIRKPWWK